MRLALVLAAAGASLLALAGCASSASEASVADTRGTYVVTIDGTGTALISTDSNGASEQQADVSLPYSTTLAGGVNYAVSAQLSDEFGSEISCSITASDGSVLKSARSTGAYAVVACAANLP